MLGRTKRTQCRADFLCTIKHFIQKQCIQYRVLAHESMWQAHSRPTITLLKDLKRIIAKISSPHPLTNFNHNNKYAGYLYKKKEKEKRKESNQGDNPAKVQSRRPNSIRIPPREGNPFFFKSSY